MSCQFFLVKKLSELYEDKVYDVRMNTVSQM